MSVQIVRPASAETNYSVDSSGNICARAMLGGKTSGAAGGTNAYVYQDPSLIPNSDPGTGTPGTPDDENVGLYYYSLIPGAGVGQDPNYCVIWSGTDRDINTFYGVSAGTTECDAGPTPGGGGSNYVAQTRQANLAVVGNSQSGKVHQARGWPAPFNHTTPPRVWDVNVKSAFLNYTGLLLLTLDKIDFPSGSCVWTNKLVFGGVAAKDIKLSCESPIPRMWNLSFKGGPTYQRLAAAFNMYTSNELWQVPGPVIAAPPPGITIWPG